MNEQNSWPVLDPGKKNVVTQANKVEAESFEPQTRGRGS